METLEVTLQENSVKKSVIEDKKQYNGLQLIEEKSYNSGTSIKYWM